MALCCVLVDTYTLVLKAAVKPWRSVMWEGLSAVWERGWIMKHVCGALLCYWLCVCVFNGCRERCVFRKPGQWPNESILLVMFSQDDYGHLLLTTKTQTHTHTHTLRYSIYHFVSGLKVLMQGNSIESMKVLYIVLRIYSKLMVSNRVCLCDKSIPKISQCQNYKPLKPYTLISQTKSTNLLDPVLCFPDSYLMIS